MKTESQVPRPAEPEDHLSPEPAITESNQVLHDLAEQKDLYLRLAADFENFKRRSRLEVETRAAAMKESFIIELLAVTDNLERALAAEASADPQSFHQGVEMTWKQLQQLLRQHGVESEELIGKPFDPHRHEALAQGHDPAQPDQTILQVIQRGYRRGLKILRPAKVVVNELALAKPQPHGR